MTKLGVHKTEEEIEQIKTYILMNWHNKSIVQIARDLGISRTTVTKISRKIDIPSKLEIINFRANLSNRCFGKLSVIKIANPNRKINKLWECKCKCGKIVLVPQSNLTSGHTKSCGCYRYEYGLTHHSDLIGQKFGRLLVVKRDNRKWLCKCDCGNELLVSTSNLRRKNTTSCGCYWKERISGPNSIWWRGGTTKINDLIRRSFEHRVWTKKVKAKHNNACQSCGKTNGVMCAHHLWSFYKYPDKRLDENNGTCLCWDCHEEFHKGKNLHDITPKSLSDFISKKALNNP